MKLTYKTGNGEEKEMSMVGSFLVKTITAAYMISIAPIVFIDDLCKKLRR